MNIETYMRLLTMRIINTGRLLQELQF